MSNGTKFSLSKANIHSEKFAIVAQLGSLEEEGARMENYKTYFYCSKINLYGTKCTKNNSLILIASQMCDLEQCAKVKNRKQTF